MKDVFAQHYLDGNFNACDPLELINSIEIPLNFDPLHEYEVMCGNGL